MYLAEYLGLYLWRNADGVPGDGGPPDHQVGEGGYPHDAAQESDGEEFTRYNRENKVINQGKCVEGNGEEFTHYNRENKAINQGKCL